MSLTNAQYDTVMREYGRRAGAAQRTQADHVRQLTEHLPGYREADQDLTDLAVQGALLRSADPQADLTEIKARMAMLEQKKRDLLLQSGYPDDYAEIQYCCSDCRDTGYIGEKKCHCFQQMVVDLFYTQQTDRMSSMSESFENFRLDLYPERPLSEGSASTVRDAMSHTLQVCREYAQHFDDPDKRSNLLFFGGVGLGKTFLSRCIAQQLQRSGYTVLYNSAADFFSRLADETFHRGSGEGSDLAVQMITCDLLILDDLGTELTNSFVSSSLFDLLNRRMALGRPLLFSTNLSLKELSETYSERCISRILGSFTMLPFYGDDIRLKLRLMQ